jgi:5-formyltetrahydrofolate cyclo-ligase
MTGQSKKELRRLVKLLKEKQETGDYFSSSALIMKSVEAQPAFRAASTVMIYWSIRGEVFTHDFIRKWSGEKRFVLPSVNGEIMNLKLYGGEERLVAGDLYQIPEPDGPLFDDLKSIDLVIVPGIAFDRKNNRMGRGKAYYDRFLKLLQTTKIGVCFTFQLFDVIPADENDVGMDMVITG